MRILSHRGVHRDCPENTLAAFLAAARLGVAGIETDLRVSADGAIVLYHDRHAPDGRCVSALSRKELCDVAGYEVPTLEEAVESLPNLLWNLEIKDYSRVDALIEGIARVCRDKEILVTSFCHAAAARIAASVPVECGFLVCHRPKDAGRFLASLEMGSVRTIVWSFEWVDEVLLRECRRQGFLSYVYDVVSVEEHTWALGMPLEGVITDWPERTGVGGSQ